MMETAYFTFGQSHIHRIGNRLFDKDTVVKITSENPRQTMFETFGMKWALQYDEPPRMQYFPKGIVEL